MFLRIFILPLLAFILTGVDSYILASLSDEESPKLFNASGNKASLVKIRNFLSPCFEVKKVGQIKLLSEPEAAVELLGKFATQFVKETSSKIANKDALKDLFWARYRELKELTINTSHTTAPFFQIGRFSVEESIIISIENALTSKVKIRQNHANVPSASASTSQIYPPSEVSTFVLTHTRSAFVVIKQMTCLSLLSTLKELGETVDEELAQHKNSEVLLGDLNAIIEEDDDVDWDEELRSALNKIDTQNRIYQTQRTKYLELLSEWGKAEALERIIPKKKHLVKLVLSFLGVTEEDHEDMKEHLFTNKCDSNEEPESSCLDVPLDVKALDAENADAFLQNFQRHVRSNLFKEGDDETLPASIRKIQVVTSLLFERLKDQEIETEVENAKKHFNENRGKLNVLAREVKTLEAKILERVKKLKELNEPLDDLLGNFHAYLGGYSFKHFLDSFALNPESTFEEKMDSSLTHFPETNREFVDGLWRFMHGIQ